MARKQRPKIGINLSDDVEAAWYQIQGTLGNTRMGIAGLAAYAILDSHEREALGTLVAAVDDKRPWKRAKWAVIAQWIEEMRKRRTKQIAKAGRQEVSRSRGKAPGRR